MTLHIADIFTDSPSRLTSESLKVIKTTEFDLNLRPTRAFAAGSAAAKLYPQSKTL